MSKAKTTPGRVAKGLPLGPLIQEILALAYRARLPVLLEGPTGIGKSEIVAQTAQALGIGHCVLDLSLLEPPDLVGLPLIQDGRTIYAMPQALPAGGAGILLLEELNRAERYVQQPALQLLTARRLHEYELPADWLPCAAINPESDEYQVTPLDPALRARFLHLEVRADRKAWIDWAEHHGVHPAILALARHHDHFLDQVPPRTWTYVSRILQAAGADELRRAALLRPTLGGYLPLSWVESVLDAVKDWSLSDGLEVEAVLRDYDRSPEHQKTVAALISGGKTDVLEQIAHRVLQIVDGPELQRAIQVGGFRLDAFERLIRDLPGDHRETIQRALSDNLFATPLIPLKPADVLRGYAAGSPNSRLVQIWAKDAFQSHRVGILANALRHHLVKEGGAVAVRQSNSATFGLGQFLADAGPGWSKALREALTKLGIEPLKR
jgi:hypothetical protein